MRQKGKFAFVATAVLVVASLSTYLWDAAVAEAAGMEGEDPHQHRRPHRHFRLALIQMPLQ